VTVAATKNYCFIQSGMCQKNWRTTNSSKHQVDKDSYAEYLMWMQDRIA